MHRIFEPTGHVWAHNRCAAWSEGVTAGVDGSLLSVDQAVFNGLSQKCSYCRRYGATITCIYPECSKKYHYPCAAAGACFQDKRSWPFCVLITRIKPRQLLERRRFVCSVARRTRLVNSCSVRPVDTTIMVAASTPQSPSHLRYGQAGSVLTVRCARCADNQEKTVRCWSVTHVTRVTTPSV